MAENPSVTVSVIADIKALNSGLSTAEGMVAKSADRMGQTMQRGIFNDRNMMGAAKAVGAATQVMQTDFSSLGSTIIGVSGAIAMLPHPITKVVGLLGVLAGQIVGVREEAEKMRKAQEDAFRAMQDQLNKNTESASKQVREVKMLVEIEKEMDPIKKRELELEMELLKLRKERLEISDKVEAKTAMALFLAKEELAVTKAKKDIDRIQDEQAKAAAPAKVAAPAATPQMNMANLVNSLTTSLGGTFKFAENETLRNIQTYAVRQFGVQANMLTTIQQILQALRNGGTVIT